MNKKDPEPWIWHSVDKSFHLFISSFILKSTQSQFKLSIKDISKSWTLTQTKLLLPSGGEGKIYSLRWSMTLPNRLLANPDSSYLRGWSLWTGVAGAAWGCVCGPGPAPHWPRCTLSRSQRRGTSGSRSRGRGCETCRQGIVNIKYASRECQSHTIS